jgi:hypothetical protein
MGSVGLVTALGMAVSARQPVVPGPWRPGGSFVGESLREALLDEQFGEGFLQGPRLRSCPSAPGRRLRDRRDLAEGAGRGRRHTVSGSVAEPDGAIAATAPVPLGE